MVTPWSQKVHHRPILGITELRAEKSKRLIVLPEYRLGYLALYPWRKRSSPPFDTDELIAAVPSRRAALLLGP